MHYPSFKQYLTEAIYKQEANNIRAILKPILADVGIEDLRISGHFIERSNESSRNENKPIDENEIIKLFQKQLSKNKNAIKNLRDNDQITLIDRSTNINIGVIKDYDILVLKTIIRKKGFRTSDRILAVF